MLITIQFNEEQYLQLVLAFDILPIWNAYSPSSIVSRIATAHVK